MHWQRLGQIYDATRAQPFEGCCGFAQSPQALLCDDRVRVYFSARSRDATGEYLSRVAYAEYDRSFSRLLGVSRHAVVPLGPLGSFDEHGIFPFNVLRVGDAVYGYTTGWSRRRSVPVDAAIGLVVSHDGGRTFRRSGDGPVLGPSLHQPFLVGDAFVVHWGGRFRMWYIHGLSWLRSQPGAAPERVYKIAYAESPDGRQWTPVGRCVIPDRLGDDECQALPTVVRIAERYHMWFCYRHATGFREDPGRGYRIGHAWSDDLLGWHRDDAQAAIEPSAAGWDSGMLCYPHVFHCDGEVLMLYNGNAFGRDGFGLARLAIDHDRERETGR